MRPIWKGAISFGLVNIPIGLYSATTSTEDVKFRMLRKTDHSPIKYKRVAETDGKEVAWEEIVKGYEYEKGTYVIFDKDDFEKVDPEKTQRIDIEKFVDLDEVDPIYFSQPYYIEPEKGGDKAYALLCHALKGEKKMGIAKVVIKTKQYLAAVKPKDDMLILEVMHFADELVEPEDLKIPHHKMGDKEMKMACQLVDSMADKWDPEEFKNDYKESVMQMVEKKIASGGKELPSVATKTTKTTKTIDLVAVLQKSLEAAHKGKSKKLPVPAKTISKPTAKSKKLVHPKRKKAA
ncbi:MAG: Ku protein [Verrucomicrobiota bacterium]|nr:Ku protein [Verrucomicrobiota bacterium]